MTELLVVIDSDGDSPPYPRRTRVTVGHPPGNGEPPAAGHVLQSPAIRSISDEVFAP